MSFFESVSSIVKNLSDFYSEINSATLTGAIDVIVVEQEDGSLKSSPFHVKFGKLGVLKAREKIVSFSWLSNIALNCFLLRLILKSMGNQLIFI